MPEAAKLILLNDNHTRHAHRPPRRTQELSLAAGREPPNIEGAARAKEVLIRARAPEAAVWVLSDPAFLEDACRLLVGLVTLGRGAAVAEAGPGLCHGLQRHVLRLSPAVVVVRCLRANIGDQQVNGAMSLQYGATTVRCHYSAVPLQCGATTVR